MNDDPNTRKTARPFNKPPSQVAGSSLLWPNSARGSPVRETVMLYPHRQGLKLSELGRKIQILRDLAVAQARFATVLLTEFSLDLRKQHDVSRRREDAIVAFRKFAEEGLSVEIQDDYVTPPERRKQNATQELYTNPQALTVGEQG
ncbi:hypothetical protein C8F01DRAFT_1081571 [Mycena amicta]|nr:hypothetical protein C8F01DRAFT_1081571 [Mycena amicta]